MRNRVVLITGCSSPDGIGFATARALAISGCAVHATVRDHSHDDELLDGVDGRLEIHDLDVRDRAGIDAVVNAVSVGDGLDVLINNAGYGLIGGVEQVDLDRARASFETNFFGTMALIQAVLPGMRGQRSVHIINVSTVFAAGLCLPALGYYIASKAALETAAQALAVDRLSADQDPRPSLSDELYQWVLGGDGPEPQSAAEVAHALCELVQSESAELAEQSGQAARAYVAAALRDPSRERELAPLLSAFAATWSAVETDA